MKTLNTLKPNNKLYEKEYFVFDTETRGLRAKSDAFIFGVVYGFDTCEILYSVEDFKCEFLKPKYKRKKVFAHNAEYDLNVIYDNIYNLDKEAIFNGKFICATNGNCTFADSLNIFRTSVKNLGQIIGKEKQDIESDYIEGTKDIQVTRKMIDYCIRDCEIVYESLLYIFNLVGNIKITIAGLSLDFFRRNYLKYNIDYNEILEESFFDSYVGGRCEAFFIGKVNSFVYDVNSMYPNAMLNCWFPNPKYLRKIDCIKPELFIKNILPNYEGCARIKLFHVSNYIGFLPLKKDGKLLFPVGNFEGHWNFNEIRFALENKMIIILEVNDLVFSERMESPFKDFVSELYLKRKNTKIPIEKETLKLILNSLYGKFAQRIKTKMIYIDNIDKRINIINEYNEKRKLIKIHPFNAIRKDCFIEVKNDRGFLYHTIPSFSSYITSYSRIELLKLFIKYESAKIVYCDTDSIFVENKLDLKQSDKLGELKLEEKTISEIRGLKNYSYISDNKIKDKIKGVPKSAEMTDYSHFTYMSLIGTKEGLRRNKIAGINEKRVKIITNKYDKRIVLTDGNTTAICLD
jgi:DNA polymerase type B, organellar and viral